MKKNKILAISNMYPKNNEDYFGIFVKKIDENLKLSFDIKEVLLIGKTTNNFKKLFRYIFFYINVFFELFFNRYNLIYVHYPTHSLPPILFFPFLKNTKVVLNFHGSDINLESKLSTLFLKYFSLIKPYVKLVIVPSDIFKGDILKKIQYNNILVSPSGGIPDFFYHDYDSPKTVKTQNLRFIFISSIIESKGIFTLIDSVKLLYQKNGVELDLTIYGSGNANLLQTKISELKKIKYMGVANNHNLPKIFSNFDVLIFPTKRESLGLIGIEALACGIPVIASDIPIIKSYVKHNFNGLLFESENSRDLMNKIDYLLKNPDEYRRLKSNSRNSVLDFKQSKIAKDLNTKISEII